MGSITVGPDIVYEPDYEKYQLRTKRRLDSEDLPKSLPEGFPKVLDSPLAWDSSAYADFEKEKAAWVYELSDAQLTEIADALAYFKGLGKPLGFIKPETFPLPTLHEVLRSLSHDLHFGRGFAVLRRLPVEKYTREEIVIIYAGVSSHVSSLRGRQDTKHDNEPADVVLSHVIDLSHTKESSEIGAPAYTTDKQVFHTDTGDIVSLLALSEAAKGGESQLASSWNVYNELAASRPDLIHTLSEDWIIDGFKNNSKAFFKRPLLYYLAPSGKSPGRVIMQYSRRTFTGFGALPRSSDISPISEAQAEALDALHFIAEKNQLELDIKKGDIQYINNLSVFHARRAFVDDAKNRRHLLRLWLRDPEYAWETPEPLKERWDNLYGGVTAGKEVFPLDPVIRGAGSGRDKP